jgi:hypothetical protein
VKNLNADRVDGKSAEDFVDKGSLLFARIADDGTVMLHRGVVAGTKATPTADGENRVFTVQFAGDVSKCVATASPTSTPPNPAGADDFHALTVVNGTNPATFVVTEVNAGTSPYGFAIQVTC